MSTKLASISMGQCADPTRGNRKTLFQQWPKNQLTPEGNPAYEGVGYPAAGYGQSRRKVVGLAKPKAVNPQLVGWENPQPVGTRITTQGTLNVTSDVFKREQVAALAGLGCACSQTDRKMLQHMNGIGLNGATEAESFADSLKRGITPAALAKKLLDKLKADEAAAVASWNQLQTLKKMLPGDPQVNELEQRRNLAWGELNAAKFYALFLPSVRDEVRALIKAGKMTPPNYAYIKAKKDQGLFAAVAEKLRELAFDLNAFKAEGILVDKLGGLGAAQAAVVVPLIAIGAVTAILAYTASQAMETMRKALDTYTYKKCADKSLPKDVCIALANTGENEAKKKLSMDDYIKYGGYALGGILLLNFLPIIRDTVSGLRSK